MTTPTPQENPLAVVARECGLDETDAMVAAFMPYYTEAAPLVAQAAKLTVTSCEQVAEMQASRQIRLDIRQIRIRCDKTRQQQKATPLLACQNIDKLAGAIIKGLDAEEERLDKMEKFAINAQRERIRALGRSRYEELNRLGTVAMLVDIDILGARPQEEYDRALEDAKAAHTDRVRRQEADEKARKEQADKDATEKARLEEDNRKLREANLKQLATAKAKADEDKRERDRVDAEAKTERDRLQKQADDDRKALEDAQAQQRAKDQAEADRLAGIERQRKAEAAAPDRERVLALARAIKGIELPTLSEDAKATELAIANMIGNTVNWLESRAAGLGGGS